MHPSGDSAALRRVQDAARERHDPAIDPATVVRAHQAAVWRYLRFLGADRALADDLAQETFVTVLAGATLPCDPGAHRAYLRKVARSLWIKTHRRRPTEPLDDAGAIAALDWFSGTDDGVEFLDALTRCKDELSPRQRHLIELRYRDGRSRRDVARALDLSVDGIKSLTRRTLARLRVCVERRMR